ncbi:MAG: hypothetical protein ACLGHN_09200 [Bacteriovoracia bacterium]
MKFFIPILFLNLAWSAPDPDLICKNIIEIKFDQHGSYKDYSYDWAQLGDYVVWDGENVPQKVINKKEKSECQLSYSNIRSIKKFKDYDLLFVDASQDKFEYTAVIQMKDCKKLWELKINTEVSELTFNTDMKVITNKIKGSVLDNCGHCWNDTTEACRNLPVTR